MSWTVASAASQPKPQPAKPQQEPSRLPSLPSDLDLSRLSKAQKLEFALLLEERQRRLEGRKIDTMYPDVGPLRRELYPKHMAFFEAGARYPERLFCAANRIGKSEGAGGYETALHLTGRYPSWWRGRRWDRSVRWWAAGKTNETTRDIIQTKLLGKVIDKPGGRKAFSGTGLIYADCIGDVTWKQGVANLADTVAIKHVSGEWSELGLKSYQQGRGSFEGTERDGVWLDEEPPLDIYTECLIRTMTVEGLVMMTFTPLEGMTETVLQFLPSGLTAEQLPDGL